MEDIGMRWVSEVRAREEVNGEGRGVNVGEKRQKLLEEDEQVLIKPAAAAEEEEEAGNNNNNNNNSGGGGGLTLLDNLLAKLSSPTPPTDVPHQIEATPNADADANANGSGSNGNDGGGGGGVINNIISTIFHRGGTGEDEEVKAEATETEGKQNDHGVEKSEGSSGKSNAATGGGSSSSSSSSIISNLLPDEIAPASSDEASILIHSVVHD